MPCPAWRGRDSRIGILEGTLVDCLALGAGGRTIGVVAWDVSLADCLAVAGAGGGIGAGRARGTAEVGALFLLLGPFALVKTLALFDVTLDIGTLPSAAVVIAMPARQKLPHPRSSLFFGVTHECLYFWGSQP